MADLGQTIDEQRGVFPLVEPAHGRVLVLLAQFLAIAFLPLRVFGILCISGTTESVAFGVKSQQRLAKGEKLDVVGVFPGMAVVGTRTVHVEEMGVAPPAFADDGLSAVRPVFRGEIRRTGAAIAPERGNNLSVIRFNQGIRDNSQMARIGSGESAGITLGVEIRIPLPAQIALVMYQVTCNMVDVFPEFTDPVRRDPGRPGIAKFQESLPNFRNTKYICVIISFRILNAAAIGHGCDGRIRFKHTHLFAHEIVAGDEFRKRYAQLEIGRGIHVYRTVAGGLAGHADVCGDCFPDLGEQADQGCGGELTGHLWLGLQDRPQVGKRVHGEI